MIIVRSSIQFGIIIFLSIFSCFTGCKREIGDECIDDSQCDIGRICDLKSEGGYCTITPCSPESCPNDSTCVQFINDQSYCMAVCDRDDDCREGYRCDQETANTPFCRQL